MRLSEQGLFNSWRRVFTHKISLKVTGLPAAGFEIHDGKNAMPEANRVDFFRNSLLFMLDDFYSFLTVSTKK
jgi:hypothetical protein